MNSNFEEFKEFCANYKDQTVSTRNKLPEKSPPFKFDVLKILKNISTTDITNISFPVFVNEPLSTIQRVVDSCRFYNLMTIAAEKDCLIERLAYLAAFNISTCSGGVDIRNRKPFNPILGETYEYYDIKNRFLVVGEQVSHHPPISVVHMQSDKWEHTVDGDAKIKYLITKIDITWNKDTITFFRERDETYLTSKPKLTIHSISSSNKWVEYKSDSKITLVGTKACANITFHKRKKGEKHNDLDGYILDKEGKKVATIYGSYQTKVILKKIDQSEEIVLWTAPPIESNYEDYYGFNDFSFTLNDQAYTPKCPTDSRYRKDILFLEQRKEKESDEEKKRLEAKQRETVKKRKKEKEDYNPLWFTLKEVPHLSEKSYAYNGNYWKAKLEENYPLSPDLF